MGLDMFLMRANRDEADGWDNLNTSERTINIDQTPWAEVCYWRKANQIRQWFVDNCDYSADGNCEEVEVTKENLEELVEVCRKVLENHALASELLPHSKGFFFGSDLYDEWYFEQLEDTVSACENIIRDTDWEKEKSFIVIGGNIMGVDIHMGIVSEDGKYIYEEIFDGRNSEWFDNISGYHIRNSMYEDFPCHQGIPDYAPESLNKYFNQESYDYYGFNYVKVADFYTWFTKTRPDIDAGWVSTYDEWLYKKKGIVPEFDHYLDKGINPNDYHFIEVENKYDCSKWLFDFLTEHNNIISHDDYIVYYFDC